MPDYTPKLATIGDSVSPEVLLHRTLDKLAHIKAVVVIIQWNDNSFATDWSTLKLSELTMAEKVLSLDVSEHIKPNDRTDD